MWQPEQEKKAIVLARPTRALFVLGAFFLACIAFVITVEVIFDHVKSDLAEKRRNESARQFIGEEVVTGIQTLEGNFYRLAATQNPAAYTRIFKAIDQRLDKLKHDLSILQEGGKVQRVLALNVGGQDETIREMAFNKDASAMPPLEVLEIAPLLEQSRIYASELERLLGRRWEALEKEDSKAIFTVEEELGVFLKRVPAYFERLGENANRLLVVGAERQREIEKDLAATERNVKILEGGLVGAIILIALTAGWLATRRIALANTQLSSAVEEIARRNALNATMLDTLSDGVYATDVNGCLIFMNAAAEATLGWKSADLVGLNVHENLHHTRPDGTPFPGVECPLFKVLAEGAALEGDEWFIARDGRFVPVSFRSRPLYLNSELAGSLVSFQDISEEVATRTRLMLVETAIRNIDQGFLITTNELSPKGLEIEWVNDGFTRLTGHTLEEARGQRTAILRSERTDLDGFQELLVALGEGRSHAWEAHYQHKDGTAIEVELYYAPVRDEHGTITNFIGLMSDIGPRKAAEAALREARDKAVEASRLKSEFLSNMSHEIRTPMNGVIGMTNLLLDTSLSAEQREFAGMVRDSADSLLTIINDILDFSKIEAGKLDIEIINYSPLQVVEGAAELLATQARAKGLSLMTFVDPALSESLSGDPTRIRQILVNLISNAVKFTAAGCVTVRAERLSHGGVPFARFSVADTGIGFSDGVAAKLFQPFVQADGSTTRRFGGTGLGLAISRRLVELMDGTISVVSEEGKGAEFRFDLPHIPATPDEAPPAGPRTSSAGRVLVVTAQAIDREILIRYLASWGISCEAVADGNMALSLLQQAAQAQRAFNIALIDEAIPDINGIELAGKIAADATLSITRTILTTTHERRDIEAAARQAGASAVLAKPLRKSQLFDAIAPEFASPPEISNALDQHQPQAAHLPVSAPAVAPTRPLILLAEDNATNQKVAQAVLAKLGYACLCVGNGQEAIEAARNRPFAAILMDCQMPVMDGFKATTLIRQAERNGQPRMPIIAMTANAMQGDRERCLAAGMDDYVAKPIDTARLAEALARWTNSSLASSEVPKPSIHEMTRAMHQLRDLFGDDAETINELLDTFRRSTAKMLEKMRMALIEDSTETLYAIGHEAKGACANLGFDQLAQIALQIETAAQAGQRANLEILVEQFAVALQGMDAALAIHAPKTSPQP